VTLPWLIAFTILTGVLLVRLQKVHVQRVADERRSLFANVREVLDGSQLAQRGVDYPVLTGDYRGAPVTVAVIVDTVTLRQLPTLWLSVTRRQPLPLSSPVDLLLRPSSTDIVSPGERFPSEHPAPPTWPTYLRVATPLGGRPDFVELSPALPLLRDKRTKDVLLTPAGARLVTELARADLGHYRLFKRSRFDAKLDAAELTAALDAVRAMMDGIHLIAADPRSASGTGAL
jgi:hypothetical protein